MNFFPRYLSVNVLHPIIKEQLKILLASNLDAADAAIAFTTGLSNILFTSPLDVMTIKLATDRNKRYSGISDCYNKLTKNGGFTNLFTGFSVSLAALMTYKFLNMALMD